MELDRGTYSEGAVCSEGIFLCPASSIILVFPSFLLLISFIFLLLLAFLFLLPFLFPFLIVFALTGCLADVKNGLADCNYLRCRERLC